MNIYDQSVFLSHLTMPKQKEEINEWFTQEKVLDYIEKEINDENIIINISCQNFYMHSVFIPNAELDEEIINNLLGWNLDPCNQWGYVISTNEICIEHSLYAGGSDLFKEGEQIIYERSFEGVSSKEGYYELNQRLSQVLDLHHMEERNAWCKLDSSGDIWDVIKVIKIRNTKNVSIDIIYANKELMGEYAIVNNYMLFRMFDITRTVEGFQGWHGEKTKFDLSNRTNLFGQLTISDEDGSYSRGFQIEKFSTPKQRIIDLELGRDSLKEEKYEKFIAHDWKNGKISEISCNPNCLASYFVDSNLPYQTTPAFFNPEVLLKYKADHEKYTLDDSTISCRGTWYLQSYGINEAGQVFTYMGYLGKLPHTEQLHWRQFNEKPKTGISEKAIRRDFLSQWDDYYDPLLSVKQKLKNLHQKQVKWWVLRADDAFDKAHYPFTDSKDEW